MNYATVSEIVRENSLTLSVMRICQGPGTCFLLAAGNTAISCSNGLNCESMRIRNKLDSIQFRI